MTLPNSPLRLLVKSYSNGLIDRQQYLDIRSNLLRKLATSGTLSNEDLQNFMKFHQDSGNSKTYSRYSAIDWLIVVLGILAVSALTYILYS